MASNGIHVLIILAFESFGKLILNPIIVYNLRMLIRDAFRDHIVLYEKDEKHIREGLYHLKERPSQGEAKTIFQASHDHKSADFEDDDRRNFSLIYKGNNEYVLMSRS